MPLIRKKKLKKKFVGKKMYKKQKCAYFSKRGIRCKRNAVGKSTLCEKHGGEKYDPTLALSTQETKDVMASPGGVTKFRLDYHPMSYITHSREGLSPVEIAAEFEVGVKTLERWAEHYSDMQTAYEIGAAIQEAWWLMKGKEGLDQRGFNTGLYKFLTGNKLGYADKVESKNFNLNATAHGVLVVPAKVSEEEWEASFEN